MAIGGPQGHGDSNGSRACTACLDPFWPMKTARTARNFRPDEFFDYAPLRQRPASIRLAQADSQVNLSS
jgi:hypothetical protein